ncbi:protein of unknown function [Xenorhabdus doucetiae]|uniref:Uncharacterized protein n=1 Tax=Xenorhabdus doucetiae TaxID=351671 RepID=A0A068QUZ5_9GAMM|nr:protein of unknown function [Xenorhabdus doucetiae]
MLMTIAEELEQKGREQGIGKVLNKYQAGYRARPGGR